MSRNPRSRKASTEKWWVLLIEILKNIQNNTIRRSVAFSLCGLPSKITMPSSVSTNSEPRHPKPGPMANIKQINLWIGDQLLCFYLYTTDKGIAYFMALFWNPCHTSDAWSSRSLHHRCCWKCCVTHVIRLAASKWKTLRDTHTFIYIPFYILYGLVTRLTRSSWCCSVSLFQSSTTALSFQELAFTQFMAFFPSSIVKHAQMC